MAGCAVSSGAEGGEALAESGKSQAAWCADLLDWPQGMPGHDTFRRVFSRLDPAEVPRGVNAWTKALREASGGARGSLDGTTLRPACARATSTAALPRVRAWASAKRLGLGQRQVEETSKAMTAMPQLLPLLDHKGAVVPREARGCQKALAQTMTAQGADAVLALQDKHPTLSAAGTRWRNEARQPDGTWRLRQTFEVWRQS